MYRYIRLPGAIDEVILMLSYVDEGATDCSNGCQTWAHHNRLGSVAKTTGFNGTVVKDSFRYSPYGESGTEGDLGFPFRFTGQKLDPETGLYYYKARYYSTETGRFLQTDPVGYDDQMNLYAYVYNDPINNTDPTGKCGIATLICAGAALGGVTAAISNAGAQIKRNGNSLKNFSLGELGTATLTGVAFGATAGAAATAGGVAGAAAAVGIGYAGSVTVAAINEKELTVDTLKDAAVGEIVGRGAGKALKALDDVPSGATEVGLAAKDATLTATTPPDETDEIQQQEKEE